MTRSDDPVEAFADMLRGVHRWIGEVTETLNATVADVTAKLDEHGHRGEHVPPNAGPRDCCSTLALDAERAPGTTVMSTRLQCLTCGTRWAPVFNEATLVGWTVTPVNTRADARYMPVPGEHVPPTATRKLDHVCDKPYPVRGTTITCRECGQDWTAVMLGGDQPQWMATTVADLAPSLADRPPGRHRWRTGRPHVVVEREALLFEQTDRGDRFIGEMINPEFAQWITAARALALDHDFEGGYHAASASADQFRDHYVALLELDERPDDDALRRLLTAEMARLSSIARAAAETRNEAP